MRKLGNRITLIVASMLAMVLIVLAGTVLTQLRSDNGYGRVSLPLPRQVAAIVDLLEQTPKDRLDATLRALNSSTLSVSVTETMPSGERTMPLPGVAAALRAYLGPLSGREVRAMLDLSEGNGAPEMIVRRRAAWSTHPVRLIVSLNRGGYAVIEARSALAARLTGLRLSLIALVVAMIAGGATLWVLRRQLRPLERLSAAVERFGNNLETSELPAEGSPEVRQLTEAFARLQNRIRELVAGRARMMASISHDLGTYLTRLRLRAEFIGDADQRARAIRDLDDMHALMNDTLALANLDHDAPPPEPHDLTALLRKCVDGFSASGMTVRLHATDDAIMAPVRPAIIARAFDNLISNAVKYGGEADVTIARAGDTAQILVEDRGPGIPEAERKAVFEPFYRRDIARNLDERGFGLGLAIVTDILQRHQGKIALEDREGGGLRVRVQLPLSHQQKN